jgi:predicted transcriptional regulator
MPIEKITGRKCYDHLGGQLGEKLLESLLKLGWIQLDEGKSTVYVITEKGETGFSELGVDIEKKKPIKK